MASRSLSLGSIHTLGAAADRLSVRASSDLPLFVIPVTNTRSSYRIARAEPAGSAVAGDPERAAGGDDEGGVLVGEQSSDEVKGADEAGVELVGGAGDLLINPPLHHRHHEVDR